MTGRGVIYLHEATAEFIQVLVLGHEVRDDTEEGENDQYVVPPVIQHVLLPSRVLPVLAVLVVSGRVSESEREGEREGAEWLRMPSQSSAESGRV